MSKNVFTYHLVKTSYIQALKILFAPPKPKDIPGLTHAEFMTCMTLGSPIFSRHRILTRKIAVFGQWENDTAVDNFLEQHSFGKLLARGWHVRLTYLRQWGSISGFKIPVENCELNDPTCPVVAVTIARMKFLQIPRFLRWGKPVEKLVRDNPGKTLALATIRFPRTVSTFSIWKSQKDMTDMVYGHSKMPNPQRHIDAMKERNRKDFHTEFTTLRFKPIAEYGEWDGCRNKVPVT